MRGLATGVSLPCGEAVWLRCTAPARVHATSVDESVSFAAYGRDAGLKTGAPSSLWIKWRERRERGGARLTRRAREEYRVYFDQSVTMSEA